MSSPTEPGGIEQAALDYLKGQENPFESLARPQRMDDRFQDLHVPELLADERHLLLQIIDRYRVAEYTRAADMPATRVVTILGDRGAGKTHLLRSLSYREDGKSQMLVRPSYFDMNLPFEEYLLSQLVTTLLAEDEVYHSRPIEDIAAALTRRLLRQAIRALGPTDRLFALSPTRRQRWSWLLWGGESAGRMFDRLVEDLEDPVAAREPGDLCRHHGLAPAQAFRLIQGQLARYESGPDLLPALRRELYAAMARAVLFQETEPLFRLLEEGPITNGNPASTRVELVARRLHALTEVCALVRQPIVFAFDNLERFFSPKNDFDGNLTRVFWNTLAQAVDNTRGLLFLVFAESGLFEKVTSFMDFFARDRISQGVPIFAQGPISQINLRPPSPTGFNFLIKGRLDRLLASFPGQSELPQGFPFASTFLEKEISSLPNLRVNLTRLRDEYTRQVYSQPVPKEPKAAINWESLLESIWNECLAAAGRKLTGSLASHLFEIHAGLGSLLQQAVPLAIGNWELAEVQPTASIGNHPTYGVVSLLQGKRQGSEPANGATDKIGVGFLLARGTGMPVELRAKFDFFRAPCRGDRLLLLWPAPENGENLVEMLPPATRAEWDKSRFKNRTTLHRIENNDLRTLLAFPEWLNALQTAADQPVPSEEVQAFIKQRFQSVFQLLTPPNGEGEPDAN